MIKIIYKRFPFDWTTPIGYFGCFLIQSIISFMITEIFYTTTCFHVVFCILATNLAEDIVQNLNELNENYIKKIDDFNTALLETKNKLYQIVKFHSEARQLSVFFSFLNENYLEFLPFFRIVERFSVLYSRIIIIFMLITLMAVCSLFLQIDKVLIGTSHFFSKTFHLAFSFYFDIKLFANSFELTKMRRTSHKLLCRFQILL